MDEKAWIWAAAGRRRGRRRRGAGRHGHADPRAQAGISAASPSMTAGNGAVDIAADGPDNSLMCYWQPDGAPGWNAETVAGPGTTYSIPAMAVVGSDVDIAADGPDNSLMFYWQPDGAPGWNAEFIEGAGAAYSAGDHGRRQRRGHRGPGRGELAGLLLGRQRQPRLARRGR